MHPADLEHVIEHKLRQLPQPRAPRTLRPRVMAAVRLARQSARATGWFDWAPAWQAASIATLLLLVGGFVMAWPIVDVLFTAYVSVPASASMSRAASALGGVADLAAAALVLWRVIVQPIVVYALIFVGAMCVACAVLGSALSRVALGGASHS